MLVRSSIAICVLVCAVSAALAASPPSAFVGGNDYTDTYVVGQSQNVVTDVSGGGTATLSGFWDARRTSKTLWKADGTHLYIDADASFDNNFTDGSGNLYYAANFQMEGNAANTGASNEVFEFAPGFNADRGTGTFGDPYDGSGIVGGMTTMRVHNARLVTHASQNLPTAWKHTPDVGTWFPSGGSHVSHHGLLIFSDIMNHDGSSKNSPATSSEWHVRTADQTYDGGLYWKNDWTLDVEEGVILSSNTHFEQAAIGPHVGIGTRKGSTNTTLTKTGGGALVVARGGIQGYEVGTTLDIQEGRVEFNSNPDQVTPTYYAGGQGQTLHIDLAEGAEIDFHAYTYPIETNPWSGSTGNYGPASTHGIASLDAAGLVKLGGLWSPSSDAWDQAYEAVLTGIAPETANAFDAVLDVAGDLTFAATAELQIILGTTEAKSGHERITVDGTFTQAGMLTIIDDGSMDIGSYDLIGAGSLAGSFQLNLPAGYQGDYDPTTGVLDITAIPEPTGLLLLASAGSALLRRRRK